MKRMQSLRTIRTLTAAVVTLSTSVLGGVPAVLAQDEPPVVEMSPDASIGPNQANAGEIWTPGEGVRFNILGNPNVTIRVDAPYTFASSGFYQLYDSSTGYGPQISVPAVLSNGNRRAEMTVTLSASNIKKGAAIRFEIPSSDGTVVAKSPVYDLIARLYVPSIFVNAGQSPLPVPLMSTGANSCDALINSRGGPLSPWVNYNVMESPMRTDSWFFANNTVPNATIVVSTTNYTTVQGQLQVFAEQNGCGILTPLLGFGTTPNPVVTVFNIPVGRIYFRVISGSGQPAPPPYIIRWGFVGTTGPSEPKNNPCQAAPIQPGIQYTALSDDQYDFFAMSITGTAQIQVLLQGHTIGFTQVQVRTPLKAGFTCPGNGADPVISTDRIDPFGVVPSGGGDVLLTVNIPGPGLYYIRVSLPTATGNGQPYRISWNYGDNIPNTRDPLFTSNPNQPFNPPYNGDILFNINTGQTATYYWSGMQALGSYDTIQVRVIGVTNLANCGLGDPTRTNPNTFANNWASVGTTSPRGSISIQFNAAGGYNIEFRVLQSGTQRFFDAKPLKVSCGTLMTAREYLSVMDNPRLIVPEDKLDEPLQPPDLVLPEVLPTSEQPYVEPHP